MRGDWQRQLAAENRFFAGCTWLFAAGLLTYVLLVVHGLLIDYGNIAFILAVGYLGVLLLAGAGISRIISSRRLRHPGRCPVCQYDLRGQATAGCPECGWGRAAGDGVRDEKVERGE
jgi:hypothetical protein